VLPRAGRLASRYLIELLRAERGASRELPPLVVHEGSGYTEELRRILGDA
jgi:tRNA1(Val) A37 N6-methylase TrmN6